MGRDTSSALADGEGRPGASRASAVQPAQDRGGGATTCPQGPGS